EIAEAVEARVRRQGKESGFESVRHCDVEQRVDRILPQALGDVSDGLVDERPGGLAERLGDDDLLDGIEGDPGTVGTQRWPASRAMCSRVVPSAFARVI